MRTPPLPRLCAAVAAALLCGACRSAPDAAAPAAVAARPAPAPRAAIPQEEMPDGLRYLPPPPAEGSAAKAWDEAQYAWGKEERVRNPERAARAVQDAVFTWENLFDMFSGPFGRTISDAETPALCAMMRYASTSVRHGARGVKRHYQRVRPFAEHDEPTLTPGDEPHLRGNGSYPSGHSANGWSAALLLAELRPSRAEEILARGLAAGESRVIVGVHWQSDVDAGRIVAAACVARLHADPYFRTLLEAARAECGEEPPASPSTPQPPVTP